MSSNDLSWLNKMKFQLIMLRTNNRCVESINNSVMSPNVENIHKFTQYTDYLSITKKVVITEQSIHGNVSTHKDVLLCEE